MDPKFQNIIEGALQLYSKYGIKSVTMDDIAKELGISKKTLYLYVKDKEDLVRQVMSYQLEIQDVKFKLVSDKNNNAIETLVEVSKHIVEFLKTINPSTRYDLKKYYPNILKMHIDYKRINFFDHIRNNRDSNFFRKGPILDNFPRKSTAFRSNFGQSSGETKVVVLVSNR